MKPFSHTTERLFYWLVFLFALGIRLFQLGAAALSDLEAGWSLQALGVAHGSVAPLGAQPAYILLTSLLFYIFGDPNFLARFFPALMGSLVVWVPYLFRRWMGDSVWLHRAGVLMALGLAIDPALVSLSRQAGSSMPAIAFMLLALASLYDRRMVLAGIFSGLALLSGPAFLQGLLILGIAWGLFHLLSSRIDKSQLEEDDPEPPVEPIPASSLRVGGLAFAATVVLAGSLFLRLPQGLGALADTLSAYLQTWVTSSGVPILRLPASLLIYQPLVLIFAIIGGVRAWFSTSDDERTRIGMVGISLWALAALVIPLLYAGRQVGDLAWALIPLWALAAVEISRSFLGEEDSLTRMVAAGLTLLLFALTVIGWINLLTIGRYQLSVTTYWVIVIGAFLLGFIAVMLVIAGWSAQAAKLGIVWALCGVLGLQLFANAWGMSILHQNGAQELWSVSPTPGQADLLIATLKDLSSWNTGLRDQLEIVVLSDSPALKWALRDFPHTRFESILSSTETPPVVITPKGTEELKLTQQYRGQDFIWRLYPGWQGVFPPNFINWYAFRQAPLGQEQIILWARTDIFPDGGAGTIASPGP